MQNAEIELVADAGRTLCRLLPGSVKNVAPASCILNPPDESLPLRSLRAPGVLREHALRELRPPAGVSAGAAADRFARSGPRIREPLAFAAGARGRRIPVVRQLPGRSGVQLGDRDR